MKWNDKNNPLFKEEEDSTPNNRLNMNKAFKFDNRKSSLILSQAKWNNSLIESNFDINEKLIGENQESFFKIYKSILNQKQHFSELKDYIKKSFGETERMKTIYDDLKLEIFNRDKFEVHPRCLTCSSCSGVQMTSSLSKSQPKQKHGQNSQINNIQTNSVNSISNQLWHLEKIEEDNYSSECSVKDKKEKSPIKKTSNIEEKADKLDTERSIERDENSLFKPIFTPFSSKKR